MLNGTKAVVIKQVQMDLFFRWMIKQCITTKIVVIIFIVILVLDGGNDFILDDNCNTNNNSNYENSDHSYDTYNKKYALAGTYYFIVKDYEVYQLELE